MNKGLPNPQNPYQKRNRQIGITPSYSYKSKEFTGLRTGANSLLPALQETRLTDYQSTDALKSRSSHQMQLTEKFLRHESVLESFLVNTLTCPLHMAIEQTISITLRAKSVTFWHDIPSLHILYSQTLSKTCAHSTGLVGFTFFAREMVKSTNPSNMPAYSEDIDGKICPGNTPVLLFPLWDSNNNVCAVIQVTRDPKDPFFDENDEDFIQFFIKKFKVYSHWLFQNKFPHDICLELMQSMEIEQFLLLFHRKMTALFNCSMCELWKYHMGSQELYLYKKGVTKMNIGKAGIAGDAIIKESPINCACNKMQSSYYANVDGNEQEAVLAVPLIDYKQNMKYAVVLRGRKNLDVFTTEDELTLRSLAPYLILGLDNSERLSNTGRSGSKNAVEHRCVQALSSSIEKIAEQLPMDEIIVDLVEKTESLVNAERSFLFVQDIEKELLRVIVSTNVKMSENLTLPMGHGIVGRTFREKKPINLPDAYEDPSFDASLDLETGYRTGSLVTVPVLNNRCEAVAVAQFLNKKDGKPFSNMDIGYIRILLTFVGMMMENKEMFQKSSRATMLLKSYIAITDTLGADHQTKAILSDIMKNAKTVTSATGSSLFIHDDVVNVLTTYISDCEKMPPTIPLSHGIAATTVKTKESIMVNDAYHDPRFNKMIDYHTTFKTKSVLTAPVLSSKGHLLGVLEVVNKIDGDFLPTDQNLLKSFATFMAVVLETGKLRDLAERGNAEIEMSKWLGDIERKAYTTPSKLTIQQTRLNEIFLPSFNAVEWNGIGLFKIVFAIFNNFHLLEQFQISNEMFFTFIYRLREMYNEPPFHNWIHAIDVLQFYIYQIKKCNFDQMLTGLELLAISVACLTHDVGHLGLSNEYLENTKHPIGILYKGISPSERYHCSKLIELTNQRGCNIFHALPEPDLAKLWSWIIHLILATDMSRNSKIIKQANDIMDEGPINLSNEMHRLVAMALMMNAANISNVCRPFQTADQWVSALLDEFYAQGDLEASHKMEYSNPMNDRDSNVKEQCQILYISDVCMPLFHVVARIFGELESNIDMVLQNLEKWKEIKKQSDKAKQAETGEETEE